MTWRDLVRGGERALREAGCESAGPEARVLAEHVAGSHLVFAPAPSEAMEDRYRRLVSRRARGIPLQHVTGTMYFRDLQLPAAPGVFIVRPETEVVAGAAIEAARSFENPLVVDLCTGSGAIAISVATEVPTSRVVAVEYDSEAFAHGYRNAQPYDNVTVVQADARVALEELAGQVNVVVSNPPYVPARELPRDVGHDPHVALFGGGADGLDLPRALVERAAHLLAPGGWLIMEHDDTQGQALLDLAVSLGFTAETGEDLVGRPRYLRARL